MMFRLAHSNAFHRPVKTISLVLLVVFSCGMLSFVMALKEQAEKCFVEAVKPIDLVAGAKGSSLQLLLSSVFQMDDPVGNIALENYQELKRNPQVKKVIPLSFGDSFQGFSVIGTIPEYFTLYNLTATKGEINIAKENVVVGYAVAQQLGLKVGQVIHTSHGRNDKGHVHGHELIVAGILASTGLPSDQFVFTSLDVLWEMHHQAENQEITAVLIQTRSPLGKVQLPSIYNRRSSMQIILPAVELNKLNQFGDAAVKILVVMGWVLLCIAVLGIYIAMNQRVNARANELFLLRSMGWSRVKVAQSIFGESLIIMFLPVLPALLIAKITLWLTSDYWYNQYAVYVKAWTFHTWDLLLLLIVFLSACLVSVFPAFKTFKNPIYLK